MRIQAVVLAVLLMACGGGGDEERFSARFDVCFLPDFQYCDRGLEVTSGGSGDAFFAEAWNLPAQTWSVTLTEAELQGLLADVELARTVEWEPSYESPDRYDNYRFILVLSDADGERRTVLEPVASFWPEHLAPLMTRLRDVYRATLP